MSTIRYPIPYQIYGVTGRSPKPSIINIADEITFEIDDYTAAEAPVAVSVMKPWPHATYHTEFERRIAGYDHPAPETLLRRIGDALYAPVVKVMTRTIEPVPATAGDFWDLFCVRYAATPMKHLYANHNHVALKQQGRGELKSMRDIRIRKIGDTVQDGISVESREFVLNQAVEDAKTLATIDGELWKRLPADPILHYVANPVKREIIIDIEPGEFSEQREYHGYFRIDRLEDCLDHLAAAYPDYPVSLKFKDLKVFDSDVLTYRDEERALVWAATRLGWMFAHDTGGLGDDTRETYAELKNLNAQLRTNEPGVDFNALGRAVETLVEHAEHREMYHLKPIVERWKFRPTEMSGPSY